MNQSQSFNTKQFSDFSDIITESQTGILENDKNFDVVFNTTMQDHNEIFTLKIKSFTYKTISQVFGILSKILTSTQWGRS